MKTRRKRLKKKRDKFTLGSFYDLWFINERESKISRTRYIKIAKLLLQKMSRHIIQSGIQFRVPKRLGLVHIVKSNYPVERVDINESVKKRKRVKLRKYGDMPVFKFTWNKKTRYTDFINSDMYQFKVAAGKQEEYWGRRGLTQYAHDNRNNPFKTDYDVL